MRPQDLTDDAKAILLLCGHFGRGDAERDFAPLGTSDYGRFSAFLRDRQLRPADLLVASVVDDLPQGHCPVSLPRLRFLLSRGAAMGFAVEGWMNKGLWVLCRSDETYPKRLKRHLRDAAPPVLYGAGDARLLEGGGLAIVGSRKIGPEEEQFASQVANRCAIEGTPVVSGGARGVDQTAMREALDAGGTVVGVLAENLLRKSLHKDHRAALHDRRLVLVSSVHPEAGFNVGAAMARNKFIYALADRALVVKADYQKGGTWTGAVEELDRPGGRPVFVHPPFSTREVIEALVGRGAIPFPELKNGADLIETLDGAVATRPPESRTQADLFTGASSVKETPPEPNIDSPSGPADVAEDVLLDKSSQPATVFDAVWPLLRDHLQHPATSAELAGTLQVRKSQLEDWLKVAAERGLVRKIPKPSRYVADVEPNLL